MSNRHDILTEFPGLVILHQKIPNNEVGRHSHDEHEFFLPLQGEITVTSRGKVIKAGPGKMLYVPPDHDHSFSSSSQGSGERLIWLINKKLWHQHCSETFEATVFSTNVLAKELLFYLLINKKLEGHRHFTATLIESLKDSLHAAQLQKKEIDSDHLVSRVVDPRVQEAMKIIDEKLGTLSLAEVARLSGLSSRNLNRLFLQSAGLTPKEFLTLRRMAKAKSLLKDTRLTITDISLEVGYNSLSKFIEAFKKMEGILPSDFRKSAGSS